MTQELRIAIVTGVLAFTGATAGTYISSYLEEQRTDRQFQMQFRVHLLDKRLSVMEQCARAYAMGGRAAVLRQYQDIEYAKQADWKKSKPLSPYVPTVFTPELQREYSSIQTEEFSCMQMATIMFGPKTLKAAKNMDMSQRTWGFSDNHVMDELFSAMEEEGSYLPPKKK